MSDPQSFTLRGPGIPYPSLSALSLSAVTVERTITLLPAARSAEPATQVEVKADDLIEIEFESGERLWMRADE